MWKPLDTKYLPQIPLQTKHTHLQNWHTPLTLVSQTGATPQKLLRNCPENMTNILQCRPGLKIPWLLIWLSSMCLIYSIRECCWSLLCLKQVWRFWCLTEHLHECQDSFQPSQFMSWISLKATVWKDLFNFIRLCKIVRQASPGILFRSTTSLRHHNGL